MDFLNPDFINQFKDIKPPFTELGEFVFYRTYSRWLPTLGRRESWLDMCTRVVNYNIGLEYKHLKDTRHDINQETIIHLRNEAELLFTNMFYLRQFLSGRTNWVGGTAVADKFPMSNFNCSFMVLDEFEDFATLFYLLMIGTGVGVRCLTDDANKFPTYRTNITMELKPYARKKKVDREELTQLEIVDKIAIIHVGDSKEGWTESISLYFKILTSNIYKKITDIIIDLDNIRPAGERLKTFGGRASGPVSLRKMFLKIDKVLKSSCGKVEPIDCLDIATIIGENVVAGGVRRTSEIFMFSPNDTDVLNAKANLYAPNDEGKWEANTKLIHRAVSNNSIYFEHKPSREQLHDIFTRLRQTGEPGFVNAEAGLKRNKNFKGVNPCGEATLDDEQLCNLVTENMMAFVYKNEFGVYCLDVDRLCEAAKSNARAAIRMTLVNLEMHEWDKKLKRDRLIGCSLTGWQDAMEAIGANKLIEAEILRQIRYAIHDSGNAFADYLGIPRPLLMTVIKPEGTISQLPTVSSGIHRSHSPYFIRRVRISVTEPLLKVAEHLGYPIFNEVGQTDEDCVTKVIEFPIKSTAKRTKYDVSALEQLQDYKMFMENYVDHNASITVSVKEHEWDEVEQWVWDNWGDVVGITFISLDNSVYQLAPYEEITEEEYNRRKSELKPFDSSLIELYEKEEIEVDDFVDDSCTSGACPVR